MIAARGKGCTLARSHSATIPALSESDETIRPAASHHEAGNSRGCLPGGHRTDRLVIPAAGDQAVPVIGTAHTVGAHVDAFCFVSRRRQIYKPAHLILAAGVDVHLRGG